MHKAFQFRLYPTKEQSILINQSMGCSRFVFNHFLAKWNDAYEPTGIEVDRNKMKRPKLGWVHFAKSNMKVPKHFRKYEKKFIRWQRILSHRQDSDSNWNKARIKVAKTHEKIVSCTS